MAAAQILWRALFIAYLLLLSWQLLTPAMIVSPGSWDKLIHFSAFFLLAGLATLGWFQGAVTTRIFVLLAYAGLTELLQHFIPGRGFSLLDWLADSLGIIAATLAGQQLLQRTPLVAKAH